MSFLLKGQEFHAYLQNEEAAAAMVRKKKLLAPPANEKMKKIAASVKNCVVTLSRAMWNVD